MLLNMRKSKSTTPSWRDPNLSEKERDEMNKRDLDIINQNADQLNAEVEDALLYQSWPDDIS